MKLLHIAAVILVAVGGINWGLIGLNALMGGAAGDWNVVNMLVGTMPELENGIYLLVGVSALWLLVTHKSHCKDCR
ncbi:MAG: hypothetical protein JWL87_353 [Candidatus Adlerbacteria bacterium]|nr:hypothetical protein [Candidatus Adlerbacteria bacterium]